VNLVDQVLGVVWREKSLGFRLNFGLLWGEICASGAPNDFSRSSETPNAPTHFPDEPKNHNIFIFPPALDVIGR
jgi:hypothetical protein